MHLYVKREGKNKYLLRENFLKNHINPAPCLRHRPIQNIAKKCSKTRQKSVHTIVFLNPVKFFTGFKNTIVCTDF